MHGPNNRDSATSNPFSDCGFQPKEYTGEQIARLQRLLDKQLGPEYISTRSGGGGAKVAYLTASKVINLAHEAFGFNGWSSAIRHVQIDFVDEFRDTGKVSLGLSVTVRVTLKDGTYHEDIGYGHIENCKSKALAFEKAKKEGATDGLKRALRTFGNVLGNCLYDKDYLAKVSKMKVSSIKWDPGKLHRDPAYGLPKSNSSTSDANQPNMGNANGASSVDPNVSGPADYDDEFGGDVFDGVEINETHIEDLRFEPNDQGRQASKNTSGSDTHRQSKLESNLVNTIERTDQSDAKIHLSTVGVTGPITSPVKGGLPLGQLKSDNKHIDKTRPNALSASKNLQEKSGPSLESSKTNGNEYGQGISQESMVGFVTSRVAEMVQKPEGSNYSAASIPAFNTRQESPSLRRTTGIDHNRSGPVARESINSSNITYPKGSISSAKTDFTNPQSDSGRRIGMPQIVGSPLANRSSYRPPGPAHSLKRIQDVTGRPPLSDVSNFTSERPSGLEERSDQKSLQRGVT